MKVCHITSVHKSNDVRIFHKECISLAENDFEVFLVVPNTESREQNGVKIIGVEVKESSRIKRFLKTSKMIYKKALEINADVYHFHDPELIRFGIKLLKKGKKVIYDVHEDVPRQILEKYWIPSFFRRLIASVFEKYENRAAKKMSYVITATPFIRDRFLKYNNNTNDIKNYPILQNYNKVEWSDKKNLICYIGGIFKIRGIEEILKSLDNTQMGLSLAGLFSPPSLKKELENLKSWKKVIYHGFLGREEINNILSEAKIGIVTLHPTVNYIDALPVKLFEYMSAGIPVIASNFPLWKEIIEGNNCGICVNPLDVNEISEAINYLTENEDIAREMGLNGRKAVEEKYNWATEEKKLMIIYKKIGGIPCE
jgi:glycosyltransferase involved in cell wall biosynthesis